MDNRRPLRSAARPLSMTREPIRAQIAQNEPGASSRSCPMPARRRASLPIGAKLQPAVVNISTTQHVKVREPMDPFEQCVRPSATRRQRTPQGRRGPTTRKRNPALRFGLHHLARRLHRHQQSRHLGRDEGRHRRRDQRDLTDGKKYTAKLVGHDEDSDLAVLKIDGQNLPFVKFGNSKSARVGDWVIAIGNPFGSATVTAGIISALAARYRRAAAPTTATSRPMQRSIVAIRAARCSTCTAT